MSREPEVQVDSIEAFRAALDASERAERARRIAARTAAELAAEARATDGHDPREDEEWFERLPEDVQEDARAAWQRQERRLAVDTPVRRARRRRVIRESALLLLVLVVLVGGYRGVLSLPAVGLGAGLGAGIGWLLFRFDMGRFGASGLGMFGYVVALGVPSGSNGLFDVVGGLYGWLSAACLFAAYGMRLEFRRLDPDEAHSGLSAAELESLAGRSRHLERLRQREQDPIGSAVSQDSPPS